MQTPLYAIFLTVLAAGLVTTYRTLGDAGRDLRLARSFDSPPARLLSAARAYQRERLRMVKHLVAVGGLALAWLSPDAEVIVLTATVATVSALLTTTSLLDSRARHKIEAARNPDIRPEPSAMAEVWSYTSMGMAAGGVIVAGVLTANVFQRWDRVEAKQDAGRVRMLQLLDRVDKRLEAWEREDERRKAENP